MLRAINLSQHDDLDPLFEHLDLTLTAGDRVGLVGPNGTGKSTLLRILAGVQHPSHGQVVRSPGLVVGWQAQEVPDAGMPVADFVESGAPELVHARTQMRRLEQVISRASRVDRADSSADHRGAAAALNEYARVTAQFESLGGWRGLARAAEVRSRLGVAAAGGICGDRPMGTLSGGEQSRVMLARLLLTDPDVLLLDEPTNHLDLEGRRLLQDHLAAYRGAVLVISHDRRFLDRMVTRVIELNGIRPELQDYPGCGYSAYRKEKQRRWERLLLDHEAQEKYRARLVEDIERTKAQACGVEAANPRNPSARRLAKKVARKALSRERRLARQMESASWVAAPQSRPPLVLSFTDDPDVAKPAGAAPPLLDLTDLTITAGERRLVANATVRLDRGDRVLLGGANGAGKTSLLRVLVPLLPGVQLLPQTHEGLPIRLSTLELFRSRVAVYVDQAEALLEAFLFDADDRARAVGELSVGEVRRLLLAIIVNQPADVLVLDEPTNHLDFDSLDVVEAALDAYRGTLVVVTHDEELAQRVRLTRRWEIAGGRLESAA